METSAGVAGNTPRYMLALEHANRVRVARAALKQRVAAGDLEAAEVVLACPWMVQRMPVADLLICQPKWGRVRSLTFLKSVAIAESKTLGSLTERQRVLLAAHLSAKPRGQPSRSLSSAG